MAESRRMLGALTDDGLGEALRELATSLEFPATVAVAGGSADLAAVVRRRIEQNPPRRSVWQRLGWQGGSDRPSVRPRGRQMRRGLVLALIALLILAAVAVGGVLGLPGLRIIFGDGPGPQPSRATEGPSASLSPLGAALGLGTALPLSEVERLAGFDLITPTDPDLGPPDATYIDDQRATLVWASRAGLPDTESRGIGLVISEFRGSIDEGYFQKILGQGTTVTRISVGGSPGFWINDAPHFFMYVDPRGKVVSGDYRVVGDVLLWTKGDVTYRLETTLGLAAATALAESLR